MQFLGKNALDTLFFLGTKNGFIMFLRLTFTRVRRYPTGMIASRLLSSIS